VDDLVDIVSKNGLLLLNIGPRPDGTIPEEAQKMLLDMGRWLSVNGEAIYGSRPLKVFGEGPTQVLSGGFTDRKQKAFSGEDIRFTSKGKVLYAIALAWPGQAMTVKSIGSDMAVAGVSLLGSKAKLAWKQTPEGLRVELPAQPVGEYAFTLKVQTK
jgi:alpha-L-fucosidase